MKRLGLRTLLSLVFGGLVLLTAALMLFIVVGAGSDAAIGDAIDKGRQTQKVLSERLAMELRAVETVAGLVGSRELSQLAALAPVAGVVDGPAVPEGWSQSGSVPIFRAPSAAQAVRLDLAALEATMAAIGREGVAGVLLENGRVLVRTRSGGRIDEASDAELAALFAVPLPPDEVVEDAPTLQRVIRDDDEPVFLSREPLPAPGLDLAVGFATTPSTIGDALAQVAVGGLVALVVALLAVALAVVLARRIARTVGGVRDALHAIAALDLDAVEPIDAASGPLSRVLAPRELEDIRAALDRAVLSLRAFGLFVPKALVLRLMERGGGALRLAEERDVTVLFTDIVGFTALAASRSPAEVTAVLDRHFAAVTAAVEAQGGTVDKYVGDGVLAYWGAPEPVPDHAARAWAAAEAIQSAHRTAVERGEITFGLRIGFHSGPVVAGTVGTGERRDYTVVGDTVNVASRLEQLGREIDPHCSCCALASGEVVARVNRVSGEEGAGPHGARRVGRHALRGRAGDVEVFRLDAPELDAPEPDAPADASRAA